MTARPKIIWLGEGVTLTNRAEFVAAGYRDPRHAPVGPHAPARCVIGAVLSIGDRRTLSSCVNGVKGTIVKVIGAQFQW